MVLDRDARRVRQTHFVNASLPHNSIVIALRYNISTATSTSKGCIQIF